jgi:hypothetical protein
LLAPILGPIGLLIAGLGIGVLQADDARKQFAKTLKKELVKYLPKIVQEQWQPIYNSVQDCFDAYEKEVVQRINDDIQARKTELDNLLQQKQSQEVDREAELQRFEAMKIAISQEREQLERTYQTLMV